MTVNNTRTAQTTKIKLLLQDISLCTSAHTLKYLKTLAVFFVFFFKSPLFPFGIHTHFSFQFFFLPLKRKIEKPLHILTDKRDRLSVYVRRLIIFVFLIDFFLPTRSVTSTIPNTKVFFKNILSIHFLFIFLFSFLPHSLSNRYLNAVREGGKYHEPIIGL